MKGHAYFFVLVLFSFSVFEIFFVLVLFLFEKSNKIFVLVLFSFSNKNMFPNKFSNKIDLHFVIFFKLRMRNIIYF